MDRDRFRQVDALFDAALDVEPNDRAAFLQEACAGDAALVASVQRLLAAHDRSAAFMQASVVKLAPELLEDVPAPGVPDRVGPFRIGRELGHGGMGVVYLAERDDGQVEQRVALKLARHGGGGEILVRRFLEERRILALLEHPGIARLIDAGVTGDGLPYFAMELVEGIPIDAYCDGRRLGIDARLALLSATCDAVQYAHEHFVIHRDLKPTNVLVREDGQIKLLDFGIAKLLDPLRQDERADTRTGMLALTPEYAAPEQVRGEPVSAATDTYALGVLLYVLLTGRRPYEVRGRSPAELEHIICEIDPPRPSATLGAAGDSEDARERAAARGTTSDKLRRRLRGDLDLIVMKALRKDPSRRYSSAAAMREDLERWRRGHPVLARPDTTGYRVRKFVARHRLGVAMSTAAILVAAGAGLREVSLRARAEAEASKAKAVENYLISVFDVADPFAPPSLRSGNVTARALLDRGAARVDSALAGHAENQAELRTVFGRVYSNLGLFDEAAAQQRRSLAERKALYGPRHLMVAEAMDALGQTLSQQDKLDEAEPLLREALAQRSAFLGNQDTVTAASIDHLASLLQSRNNFATADSLFRQSLAIRRAVVGPRTLAVAASLNNLGQSLFWKGAYQDAEPLYREALSIQEEILGPDHPSTAQTVQNLAQDEQLLRKIDEAEGLYRRALAAKRKSLDNAHPSVTITLNNLGIMLVREKGDWQTAESLIREALALDRQMFGENHANVAASLDNLGTVLREKGDFAGAEQVYREALSVNEVVLGAKTTGVALGMNNVANVLRLEGKFAEAVPLLRDAHAMYTSLLGDKHLYTLTVQQNLAQALRESGNLREADRTFREIAGLVDRDKPAHELIFIKSQLGLGQALTDEGRAVDGLPLLEKGVEMAVAKFGPDHTTTADARVGLGTCLLALRQYDKAEPVLRAAYATLEKKRRTQALLFARAARALAQDYSALGRPDDARRYGVGNRE
jgi:serine/threonine protein kinase/Tfp pilus assembly protein PilF